MPLLAALPEPEPLPAELPLPLPVAELPSAEALSPEPVPVTDPKVEPRIEPRMPVESDEAGRGAETATEAKEARRPEMMVEARILIVVVN